MFRIGNPHHSESRTVWYVTDTDRDEVAATLELGQVRRTKEGGLYRLLGVQPCSSIRRFGQMPGNAVRVERIDRGYSDVSVWNVYSFVVMDLVPEPHVTHGCTGECNGGCVQEKASV